MSENNAEYGLPEIDADTAKIINYIFRRLRGLVPALKYSAESGIALDAIRAEYTYALMRSDIRDINVINRALELVADAQYKFLPAPGEFVALCKSATISMLELETQKLLAEKDRPQSPGPSREYFENLRGMLRRSAHGDALDG